MANSSTPSDDIDRILQGLRAQRQTLRAEQETHRVQEALNSSQISFFERMAREWATLASEQPPALPTSVQPPALAVHAPPASGSPTEQPPASNSPTDAANQGRDARAQKRSKNDAAPTLPTSGSCTWSYDPDAYVIFGKLERGKGIDAVDLEFILSIMEDPNFTLVMEGLADGIDKKLWSLQGLEARTSHIVHHKFSEFTKSGTTAKEKGGYCSMPLSEYFTYLREKRGGTQILYLRDLDIPQYLPVHHHDLLRNFGLPDLLPGGSFCMMNALTAECRPYMGPNLYVTPPGSYTDFHLDGFGTVDSGHLCLSGYNEVVMLRRLDSDDQKKAMEILTGAADGLRRYPHGSDRRGYIKWPTIEKIDKCRELGYRPSVFTLKPGQYVHINKGRIHAFRKLLTVELPATDCHSKRRKDIVSTDGISEETICVSVAWDWMFLGHSQKGIHQEVTDCLDATALNRTKKVQSLACPETALLFLTLEYLARVTEERGVHPMTVLKGIFPSVQRIIRQHKNIYGTENVVTPNQHGESDPYGNKYYCGLCLQELSNCYFQCDGCESILGRDFNICGTCYEEKLHLNCLCQVHPNNKHMSSNVNHVAKKTSTGCKEKKTTTEHVNCAKCSKCVICICDCHKSFTLRNRFMSLAGELQLVERIKSKIN